MKDPTPIRNVHRHFYGILEVAQSYGIGRNSVLRLREAGVLPEPSRIGRRIVWSADAVREAAARIAAGAAADL